MGNDTLQCAVVIAAAGVGTRMDAGAPKQFRQLMGVPLFLWSARFFELQSIVSELIFVVAPDAVNFTKEEIGARISKPWLVVPGGARRQDSVLAGVKAVTGSAPLVAVHDAARPFPPPNFHEACDIAAEAGAAVFAMPVADTIKEIASAGTIQRTLDRARLWAAQTPQVFHRELLERALKHAETHGIEVTDEASAVESLGVPVRMVAGCRRSFKVTVEEDWIMARCLAREFFQEFWTKKESDQNQKEFPPK